MRAHVWLLTALAVAGGLGFACGSDPDDAASGGATDAGSGAFTAPAMENLRTVVLRLRIAPLLTFSITDLFDCHTLSRCLEIASRLRPDITLFGSRSTMLTVSPGLANSSFSLMSNHALSPYFSPWLRTSIQPPCNFWP